MKMEGRKRTREKLQTRILHGRTLSTKMVTSTGLMKKRRKRHDDQQNWRAEGKMRVREKEQGETADSKANRSGMGIYTTAHFWYRSIPSLLT